MLATAKAIEDPAFHDFNTFLTRHRGLLLQISMKHRAMGILDDEDVFQESFIAWQTCRETFDPDRNISFLRFVVSRVETVLHEHYRILRRGGITYDQDNSGDDAAFTESALASQTDTTGEHTAPSPETLLTEDPPDHSMADLFKDISIYFFSHTPLYQVPQFHALFHTAVDGDGYAPGDGAFTLRLSEDFQVTRRRISQVNHQIMQFLSHPSLRRDRKMLKKYNDVPVQLLYQDEHLLILSDQPDHERIHHIVQSAKKTQIFCVPIIVDQYFRVIDGVQRVYAARELGFTKVPVIIQVLRNSSNTPNDPVFCNTRKNFTSPSRTPRSAGRLPIKSPVNSSEPMPIFDFLS